MILSLNAPLLESWMMKLLERMPLVAAVVKWAIMLVMYPLHLCKVSIQAQSTTGALDVLRNFIKDTWRAAYSSAQVVLSAAHRLTEAIAAKQSPDHNETIYALCRPPGHHASDHMAAGYCFINNASVVARFLQNYTLEDMNISKRPYGFDLEAVRNRQFSVGTSKDKKKILIVDIDYHQ